MLTPEDMEAFQKLLTTELSFTIPPDYLQSESGRAIREYAVSYIQTISNCDNFDASVPYIAMSNLDRFLSKTEIPRLLLNKQENVNLFVICCLTIAWKMRLKSFDNTKFLLDRGLKFGRKGVIKMELVILNSLEWRLRSVNPLCFLGYFIRLLSLPPNLTTRPASQIIIWTQADIAFTKFRPSILAASAILCVSAKLFPSKYNDIRSAIFSSSTSLSQEELSQSMRKIEMMFEAKLRTMISETSSSSSVVPSTTGESSSIQTALEGLVEGVHRSGKEPIVEEEDNESIPEIEKKVPEAADLMDFKLEWVDPAAPLPEFSPDGIGRCGFIDALAKCWPVPILEAQQQTWQWLRNLLNCGNTPNHRPRLQHTAKATTPLLSASDSSPLNPLFR